ncbi:MAG: mechanosensitive ion channel [Saprospiraceae bacterium]|nr:mechanosensitive ion channel [Saprospiraceae bacterium]
MKSLLETKLLEIGGFTLTVAMVLGLIFVWLSAWFLQRLSKRVIKRGLMHANWDEGRRKSVFLIAQYLIWIAAATAMLQVIGVQITALVAGSAALLVGISLGIQQIFRDIASGVFLLFEGTIEIGDVLQVDGIVGRVEEIRLRTSKLRRRDGAVMIVPNHKFITENVLNWNYRADIPAAFYVQIPVRNDCDPIQVRRLLLDCAQGHPDVIKNDPKRAPEVQLLDFHEKSGLVFRLQFWTQRIFEADEVQSDLRFAIRSVLHDQGIALMEG